MKTLLPVYSERTQKTVLLVGNPNTGKSTLFNALTGYRQRVGNYPGVTVERRSGIIQDHLSSIELVDLPGTYSLAPHAEDEAIVMDALIGNLPDAAKPELIVCVVDASNLNRNLFFTTQTLELNKPVVVALNMMDLANNNGIQIDVDALSSELGVPVVPVVATRKTGLEELKYAMFNTLEHTGSNRCPDFPECVCAELDGLCESLANHEPDTSQPASRMEALQTLLDPGGYHEEKLIKRCGLGLADELIERRKRIAKAGESVIEVEARVRYAWIDRVLDVVVTRTHPEKILTTDRVDRVLTHPIGGVLFLTILMGICFQAIYTWAEPLMNTVDGFFSSISAVVATYFPSGALQSLVSNGVIAGVGSILIFLPQILILFLFIAILEDCGYMARAAYLLDRWMSLLGLGGKSFIPLLSSFACAVPGIMATRTIENRRDRFVTILIAPLMSCSARLPVYTLLIGAFIPAKPILGGIINMQAFTLLGMYLMGSFIAIPIALLLKYTVFKGPPQSFLMELPTYKWPTPKIVLIKMYEQGREFVVNAGTIIFAVALIIWALGYYPHPASIATDHQTQRNLTRQSYQTTLADIAKQFDPAVEVKMIETDPSIVAVMERIENTEQVFIQAIQENRIEEGSESAITKRHEIDEQMNHIITAAGPAGLAAYDIRQAKQRLHEQLAAINKKQSSVYIRHSYLGKMGRWIEPIVIPLGWDWRIGTAAIASFPAREIMVATMGTIYNMGDDQDETSTGLRDKLTEATWPDGRPVFNAAVALSIMIFFALCCQCASTLAIMKRETNSWRWPIFSFTYMTILAYVAALVTYQIAIRYV